MNNALSKLLRTHYGQLQGYISAGMESDKTADKVFMNANENPFELPGMEQFNRYPEPQPKALAEAYAKTYGVKPEQIVMTRGADEAIVMITKLFCEPHQDAVIICPPTFGMYGVNANATPAKLIEVPLLKQDGTFSLDKDNIIEAATDASQNVKLVYICTPNNPTANSLDHNDIREIISAVEGEAVVVLDETYAEFAQAGALTGEIENHSNLIVLRTLSKSYSMAGMRMGCFICADTDFIALAKAKAMDAYPLPKASVEAALHVLSDKIRQSAKDNIQKLLAERDRLRGALENSDKITHVYPSDANFLFVEMASADTFIKFAEKNNVILRDFSSKPGTENCIRISIGTPEQNDLVIKLLNDFVPEG